MFKKLLFTSVAMVVLSGAALAADLPSTKGPAVYQAPIFTWAGFYAGVNGGYAYNRMVTTDLDDYGNLGTHGLTRSDFTAGGQLGYNFQIGAFVYGIETDMSYIGGRAKDVGYKESYSSKPGFLGTVRGRAGLAVDRALFYITGGLAYGNTKSGYGVYTDIGGGTPYNGWAGSATSSGTSVGYALGAGMEYAFSDHWTARVEGLYNNLGSKTVLCDTQYCGTQYNGIPYRFKFKNSSSLLRVGINYKF